MRYERHTIISDECAQRVDHQIIHVKDAVGSRINKEYSGDLGNFVKQ